MHALGYKDVKYEAYKEIFENAKESEEEGEEFKDQHLIEKSFVLVCLIVLDDPTRGIEVNEAVSD